MRNKSGLLFIVSMLIAYALDIIPLPDVINWLRPSWTVLFFCVWVLFAPNRYNIGSAFFAGLFLDLLNGSLLGEHALAMVVVVYWMAKIHRRMMTASYLQQMYMMGFLMFIYKLIIYLVQLFLHSTPGSVLYWGSILTSSILWPWLSILLGDLLQRNRIG